MPVDMNPSYRFAWALFGAMFRFYFRWRVLHPERVPLTGPVILASNHASYLDPPLVGSGLSRRICYMARETLFRFPLVGAVMRSWSAIPLDRDGGSASGLRTILNLIQSGEAVVLFPEGTRTRDGRLQPARSGIGLMVLKTNAPVVPVRVFGTYEAFGRHMKFPLPRRVAVKYGRPMMFEELRAEARTCSKERLRNIYQIVADEILREIARLEPCVDKSTFP